MKLNKKQIGVILVITGLPFLSMILYAAARGSGTNTGRSIGSPAQQVYLPATREEPSTEGGSPFTHSTNSVNSNFTIISSAIYNLEVLAGNTNYIQLRNTLQSGATFYVSSGTIDQTLFVGSMTARGTITSTTGFVGSGFGLYPFTVPANALAGGATSYIQNTATLQASSTFYVSSATVDQALYVGSMTSRGTITSTSGFVGSGSGLYAFTIPASALQGGATSYIQNSSSLQASSTFYVSSGSVADALYVGSATAYGTFTSTSGFVGVGSSITVLNASNISAGTLNSLRLDVASITMVGAQVNLDSAVEVTGLLSGSSVSGGTFGAVNGSALTNLSAANITGTNLPGGSTSYIQNTNTLQASSTFYVSSGSVDGQTLLAITSGNVGIGTTIPGALLHVNGTSRFNEAATFFATATSSKTSLNGEHIGYTSINSATASVTNKITSEWDLQSDQGIRGALNLEVTMPVITNASRKTHVAFLTSQSGAQAENFTIDGSNVGISTSGPITALSVVGTITQTAVKSCSLGLTTDAFGSITGCAASDKSLKTNIKALEPGGAIIDGLRPVTYLWNKKAKKDSQIHAGFVAQDIEKIFPHAVVSAGEKLKGVDPNALIALLVKEVQYLRKRVMALEMGTK